MNTEYVLHYAPDNASLIIRLTLEQMNEPYTCVLVDRSKAAQRGPDYLALNPAGRIPTLETQDGPISETAAILLWLTDRHRVLAPQPGTPDRAAFLNWLLFVANTLHPDVIQLFYSHRYGNAAAQDSIQAATRKRISRHLAVLEGVAAAKPNWLGAVKPNANPTVQPSVLDFYLSAILRWLALYPVEGPRWFALSDYPQLQAMTQGIDTLPSTQAAIVAEGLGETPFSNPSYPNPPEGSAI